MNIFATSPKDHWEQELVNVSKSGLVELVAALAFIYRIDREAMLTYARDARREGKYIDARKRHQRLMQDPEAETLKRLQGEARRLKAARKRKREAANKKRGTA